MKDGGLANRRHMRQTLKSQRTVSGGKVEHRLYRLTCDDKVETKVGDDLYAGGLCPHCLTGIGDRLVGVPRHVNGTAKADLVFTRQGIHTLLLLSDAARDVLLDLGLRASVFAPVFDATGKRLYEICPQACQLAWVGLNDSVCLPAKSVYCPECGKRAFIHVHRVWGKGIFRYVSSDDAEALDSDAVIAGLDGTAEPLLRQSGYVRLLARTGLRGVRLEPVGIVPATEIAKDVRGTPIPHR